jgi:hypothetical protein
MCFNGSECLCSDTKLDNLACVSMGVCFCVLRPKAEGAKPLDVLIKLILGGREVNNNTLAVCRTILLFCFGLKGSSSRVHGSNSSKSWGKPFHKTKTIVRVDIW